MFNERLRSNGRNGERNRGVSVGRRLDERLEGVSRLYIIARNGRFRIPPGTYKLEKTRDNVRVCKRVEVY